MNSSNSLNSDRQERFDFLEDSEQNKVIFSLSKKDVEYLQKCNQIVFGVYRYEEIFCMLMNSLIAFDTIVYKYADYNRVGFSNCLNVFEKTREINQAALNYFSVLQMYCDFINEETKKSAGLSDLFNSSEFIKCKVLRNYIQHVESLPLMINSEQRLGDKETVLIAERFDILRREIKESKLKNKTREMFIKVFGTSENIDLYQILQESTDVIWKIQSKIREWNTYDYSSASSFIMEIYEKWKGKQYSLCIHYSGKNKTLEKIPFFAYSMVEEIQKIRSLYPCNNNTKVSNRYTINAPEKYVDKCQENILRAEYL